VVNAAVVDAVVLGGVSAAGPPGRGMFADAPAAQLELDPRSLGVEAAT